MIIKPRHTTSPTSPPSLDDLNAIRGKIQRAVECWRRRYSMASAARCGADSAVTPPINNQNGAKRQRTTNNKKNNTNRARFSGQRKKPRQSPGERGVGLDKVASLDPEIIRRCQAVLEKHDPLTSGEDKIESGGGTPGDSGTSRVVLASWVLNELQKCLNEERVPEEWVLNIITNWQSEAQWTPPTSWTLKRLQTYLKNGEEPPAWFKCVVTHGMEDLAERFEQLECTVDKLSLKVANISAIQQGGTIDQSTPLGSHVTVAAGLLHPAAPGVSGTPWISGGGSSSGGKASVATQAKAVKSKKAAGPGSCRYKHCPSKIKNHHTCDCRTMADDIARGLFPSMRPV